MRLEIWELLAIAVLIMLLFNGERLTRLGQAFRHSKTEYQRGVEEPKEVQSRRLPTVPELHEAKR